MEHALRGISIGIKGREAIEIGKMSKEIAAVHVPKLAEVMIVVLYMAVNCAFKLISGELMKVFERPQNQALLNWHECDKLDIFFNKNLDTGHLPEEWLVGVIVFVT